MHLPTRILVVLLTLILAACAQMVVPPEFVYRQIQTDNFTLASWQKIRNERAPYRIYIEGDGYAFNAHGRVSSNPTPKQTTMRELAFGDPADNVIYLARPCQFVKDSKCERRYWSNARFALEVILATSEAIVNITRGAPVALIGYSGGAQVAGLVAVLSEDINVEKIITIAGNLHHRAWCDYHRLPPLDESLALTEYWQDFQRIPQVHFVGEDDKVIPPKITIESVGNRSKIYVLPKVGHDQGWQTWSEEIYRQ